MTRYLKKCKECGKYSLPHKECQYCGGELVNTYPPKFSLTDKYAKYRLKYFRKEFEKKYGPLEEVNHIQEEGLKKSEKTRK